MSVPSRLVPVRDAIPEWLDTWEFTRFVTLATNDTSLSQARLPTSSLPYGKLRERLRRWDARMNHAILGKHWAKRHSDRIWCFYFLEKPGENPHWHGLVRFFTFESIPLDEQHRIFDENAGPIWKKLVPSGTVDVQPVTVQRGSPSMLPSGWVIRYHTRITLCPTSSVAGNNREPPCRQPPSGGDQQPGKPKPSPSWSHQTGDGYALSALRHHQT